MRSQGSESGEAGDHVKVRVVPGRSPLGILG